MPHKLESDERNSPLRYTIEEWNEQISNFVNNENGGKSPFDLQDCIRNGEPNPGKQTVQIVKYFEDGRSVAVWTEHFAFTMDSERDRDDEDQIHVQCVKRNPFF